MNMLGKNEMLFQENNITATTNDMVASAEKIRKGGAHTFFVQKIAHVDWGKFWIGHAIRLVYAKGFRSA